MSKLENKLTSLIEERETIITEMTEIKKAYDIRQQRLIELAGSIKTIQELLNEEIVDENNATPPNEK
jgi:hypothetical protein